MENDLIKQLISNAVELFEENKKLKAALDRAKEQRRICMYREFALHGYRELYSDKILDRMDKEIEEILK